MKTVTEIPGAEFESTIRTSTKPELVHFYTSWCGPCQILAPSLEKLAGELENQLQVGQVNLDHHPELAKRYGISNVPALRLFDHAVPIESFTALLSPAELKARLHGVLADYAA